MKNFIFFVWDDEWGGPIPSWIDKLLTPIYVLCVSSHFWPFTKANLVLEKFIKTWDWLRPPSSSENSFWRLPWAEDSLSIPVKKAKFKYFDSPFRSKSKLTMDDPNVRFCAFDLWDLLWPVVTYVLFLPKSISMRTPTYCLILSNVIHLFDKKIIVPGLKSFYRYATHCFQQKHLIHTKLESRFFLTKMGLLMTKVETSGFPKSNRRNVRDRGKTWARSPWPK